MPRPIAASPGVPFKCANSGACACTAVRQEALGGPILSLRCTGLHAPARLVANCKTVAPNTSRGPRLSKGENG